MSVFIPFHMFFPVIPLPCFMPVYFFDMDGTLIASEFIWTEAIQTALAQRGIALTFDEVLTLEYGRAWPDIFAEIKRKWPHTFSDIKEMEAITGVFYENVCRTRDIAIHSSIDTLKRLAHEGSRVYIVTGSVRARVQQVADTYGFSDCLSGIVSCEDYTHGKPNPECYLTAIRLAGIRPADGIVFEDAVTGVTAAKRADLRCVALIRRPECRDEMTSLADLALDDLADYDLAMLPVDAPVAIALGGNLGDTQAAFAEAIRRLAAGGVSDIRQASVITTAPVDCVPGTPDFCNSALTGRWHGSPLALLQLTQSIEQALGRPAQHSQHESRTIDLDILLIGDLVLNHPRLTVPHPRLHQRTFALAPLAEIAPDWRLPTLNCTVREALAALQP